MFALLIGVMLIRAQEPSAAPLGGAVSTTNVTQNAFGQAAPNLDRADRRFFFVGNSFFNQNWVQAPASTTARDGLGPFLNARSCAGCHLFDGRGRAFASDDEDTTGFLIRLSVPGTTEHGDSRPDPAYGGQFQDMALPGMQAEGNIHITYTDRVVTFTDGRTVTLSVPHYELVNLNYGALSTDLMISPRVANQMIGLGLLEAISESDLLAYADPDDVNHDGISGRPNRVWDDVTQQMVLGRFGWKANQPTLMQQVAAAFNGDIGITTSLYTGNNCTETQLCGDPEDGGAPEISDEDLAKVVLYSSTLAVPNQRTPDDAQVQAGSMLFSAAQCTACHVAGYTTGEHPTIAALSNQAIRPYTDLLLHDMGPDLADGRPDFLATGSEWRTAPLWGIGLFETVNGHTRYLHDGRARNLLEAVLWHGGEATAARDAVLAMTSEQVDALIAFLKSL